MLSLRIREKIKNNFSDGIFEFNSGTSTKEYNYERNEEEVHIDIYNIPPDPDDSGLLYNYIKPLTTYRVSLKIISNRGGFGADASFGISNTSDGNMVETWIANFHNAENNTISFMYTTSDETTLKWHLIKNAGIIDANLISIELEELSYTKMILEDSKKGILMNKSIKELKDASVYRLGYTNKFNIILDGETNSYLRYKGVVSNSYITYEAIISDEHFDIMKGSIIFNEISQNNKDVISVEFFEYGIGFFDKLKISNLKDLADNESFVNSSGSTTYENMLETRVSPQINKNNNTTFYYGVVDNGNFNNFETQNLDRGMGECLINNNKSSSHLCIASVNDLYPSVFVRKIWDQIHVQNGINYNSDSGIFVSDNFNALLLNYWKDYIISEERKEELKATADIKLVNYLFKTNDASQISSNPNYYPSKIINLFSNYHINFSNTVGDSVEYGYYQPTSGNTIMSLDGSITVDLDLDVGEFENTGSSYISYRRYENENIPNARIMSLEGKLTVTLIGDNLGEINDNTRNNFIFQHTKNIHLANYGSFADNISYDIDLGIDYNLFSNSDKYRIKISWEGTGDGENGWKNNKVGTQVVDPVCVVNLDGNVVFNSSDKIVPGNQFNYRDLVPDITQMDFIREIANLYNLRFEYNDNTKTITWYTFDEFYMKYSTVVDYTNKIKKNNIKKELGSSYQSSEYNFGYENIDSLLNLNYNNINKHKYGYKTIKVPGDFKTKIYNYKNYFGLNKFTYTLFDNNIPLTINKASSSKRFSSASSLEMLDVPYLSYQNLNSIFGFGRPDVEDFFFRDEEKELKYISIIPSSSVILYHKEKDTNSDVYTLEMFETPSTCSKWKTPNKNMYDLFLQNDWRDIISSNSEYLTVEVHLTNYEFSELKLNNIIQYEDDMHRIDKILNFNENKLTTMKLLRINFNPNYIGTVLDPFPYIIPSSYDEGYGRVLINDTTYSSSSSTFSITYSDLEEPLIVSNNVADSYYQISLNNVDWFDLNSGETFTIRTIPQLVDNENITIYYRLLNAPSSILFDTQTVAFWDFTSGYVSNGLIERVTFYSQIKKVQFTIRDSVQLASLELNIGGGGSTDEEEQTTGTQAFLM